MIRRFVPPAEPLVERNPFRRDGRAPSSLPDFDAARPRLPQPVLPQHPGWEALYWAAWEGLWGRIQLPADGSPLPAAYVPGGADGQLALDPTTCVAQLSGYLPGSFSLTGLLDNFYACQHDDGFIGRQIDPATGADYHEPHEPNSTGPNLLAWTEWRHFRLTGDRSRIADVFPALLAYHRWCRANRTWPNGLYWTTGYASGLANQPRVPNGRYHHQHWSWIDASAQAALDAALLERMAVLLAEEEAAEEVAAERAALVGAINREMWNPDLNFYQDVGPDGRFSEVKSIAAFWVLMDSQLVPPDRITPFIQHLRDTWSFRTEYVLPSLSADSEAYNARTGNGWRGAVWPSLTYMVLRGLRATEHYALAHKLALAHVDAVCRIHEATGLFWENYAPEDLSPGEPSVEDATGRTPAAIIAMILEDLIGVTIDWPLRQVSWRRCLEDEAGYGVRNLPLGDEGSLDLIVEGETLRVRADAPLTLTVLDEQEVIQTAVPAGTFEMALR